MQWYLAIRQSSVFHARRHLAVVPNVSWGLLPWEADLLVLTRTGYLNEVEIKISASDWRADKDKGKWSHPQLALKIRRFWYCAPIQLADRWREFGIPDFAGVLGVSDSGQPSILRHAKTNRQAGPLSTEDQFQMMRLAALKAWRMTYNPELDLKNWASEDHGLTPPDSHATSAE